MVNIESLKNKIENCKSIDEVQLMITLLSNEIDELNKDIKPISNKLSELTVKKNNLNLLILLSNNKIFDIKYKEEDFKDNKFFNTLIKVKEIVQTYKSGNVVYPSCGKFDGFENEMKSYAFEKLCREGYLKKEYYYACEVCGEFIEEIPCRLDSYLNIDCQCEECQNDTFIISYTYKRTNKK